MSKKKPKMNSSTEYLTNQIIDYSIIISSSISLCISFLMFIFIIYHLKKRPNSPNQVTLLLTANMYMSLLTYFIVMTDAYLRVLNGHIYSIIKSNNIIYCQICAYFLLMSICSIFYSNTLQAIYRLCRIVFYTYRFYQTFRFYIITIIIQWFICFIFFLPNLFLGDFEYIIEDFRCQISYKNNRASLITAALIYFVPISITFGCYIFTLRKIRNRNDLRQHMTHMQLITARRDLIVFFRIFILFGLMIISSIPATISYLFFKIQEYFFW